MGAEERFHIHIQLQQSWQLVISGGGGRGWVVLMQEQNTTSQFSMLLFSDVLA